MSGSTNLSNGPGKSLPTSPDDMNASLLRPNNDEAAALNNNMFGKFKGFTMRPLQDAPVSNPTSPLGPNVAFVQPVSKSSASSAEPPKSQLGSPAKSPVRSAPPVPKAPKISAVGRSQSTTNQPKNKEKGKLSRAGTVVGDVVGKFEGNGPPALPPPNPGAHPRPLISSPILESSTSTAKEMMSPLSNGKHIVPIRPAPKVESASIAPVANAEPEVDFAMKPLPPIENKGGTLRRIKSLMKKEEKPTAAAAVIPPVSTPVPTAQNPPAAKQHERKVPKFIDRNRLKTIEISAPIPQLETQTEINNRKSILARTHSMRKESPTEEAAAGQNPQLLSFGSTRSMMNRPKSVVAARPNCPPPPRPPLPVIGGGGDAAEVEASIPVETSSYQRPPAPKKVGFVDLPVKAPLASVDSSPGTTSPDNIYAVIDEEPARELTSNALDTSMESLGLLGEIVNEMENRNLGSIYGNTGMKRSPSVEGPRYANTEEEEVDQEEEEKNKKKDEEEGYPSHNSNVSTTSSGYLKPISAVKPSVASFKEQQQQQRIKAAGIEKKESEPYKPYHASINRPFASQYSVPKTKKATGAASGSSSSGVAEEEKAKKPQTPIKPVLKGGASKSTTAEGSGSKPLSNVAKMQKKFETANTTTNKK